jgi:hypothetical protein
MATTSNTIDGVTLNEFHPTPSGVSQDLTGDNVANADDEFIELYNTSASPVNLDGWEIWERGAIVHTFGPGDSIAAGGRFTIVDSDSGASSIINVSGPSDFSDSPMGLTDSDVIAIYNPGTNTYLLFQGDSAATQLAATVSAITSTHVGATQAGGTEVLPDTLSGSSAHRSSDGDDAWILSGPTPGSPNCFAAGTSIETIEGSTAVDDLQAGDILKTADGRLITVKWVGHQTITPRVARTAGLQLVRIGSGALGRSTPDRDLYVTADHALFLDGFLINAGALVNGSSITFVENEDQNTGYTVYHVETEDHEVILANGAPTETFIDYATRRSFDNFEDYLAQHGAERIIREMRYPRIS